MNISLTMAISENSSGDLSCPAGFRKASVTDSSEGHLVGVYSLATTDRAAMAFLLEQVALIVRDQNS